MPNKLLGVLGEHENFPIERLRMSRNGDLIASCSHDNSIKFWLNDENKMASLRAAKFNKDKQEESDEDSDEDDDDDEMEDVEQETPKATNNFFSGLL